jgi:hypothetical protein
MRTKERNGHIQGETKKRKKGTVERKNRSR